MQPVVNRRHCLSVLIVVLVICSAVLLNVVYELAKNFAALHRTFWTSYINHSLTHVHVPVWPSGFFPHNTYGFHPLNEHGVWCTLFTCVLVPCFIIIIINRFLWRHKVVTSEAQSVFSLRSVIEVDRRSI